MSSTSPPSKFDQPYAIIGYRIAVIKPATVHDIDYNMQLLTAPVYRIKTWKEALGHAIATAKAAAAPAVYTVSAPNIYLETPFYGTHFSRMKEFSEKMNYYCDCGQPVVLSADGPGGRTLVAITVLLGDER